MLAQRNLGSQGLVASALGLGCMGMSDFYAVDAGSEAESIATIQRALDLGITLLDTGDFYGMGHNEMLIREAIRGRRQQVILSVKFGALRDHKGVFLGFDGRPAFVKTSLAYTLQRLGVDYVDFYFPSRIDTSVPIEDTVGAMSDMVREGKLRYIGLSEAGAATIRRAHAVHPIAALQTEYSLWTRDPEDQILATTRELGIAFVAYSPLGRGFLTGQIKRVEDLAADDRRRAFPRFAPENFQKNLDQVRRVEEIAQQKKCKPSQIALAWMLAQAKEIIPIPGTKRIKYLEENIAAINVHLSPDDLRQLNDLMPPGICAGERY